jgi:cytochrome c556
MTYRPLACTLTLTALLSSSLNLYANSNDDRTKILLRPNERALMLEDMRNYLSGVREITLAIAKENPVAIEHAARRMGKIAIYEINPTDSNPAADKFRQLGTELHQRFESLADAAAEGRPAMRLLGDLSLLMNQCIKCHESYQVRDSSH